MNGLDANLVVQWLGTYAMHSTVLIGLVWVACRTMPRLGHGARDLLWKLGLVGGLVSASVQVGAGVRPLSPTVELTRSTTPVAVAPARPVRADALRVDEDALAPMEIELAALGPAPAPISTAPSPAELEVEPADRPSIHGALLLVGAWLLLASALLARLGRGYGRLHRGLARRRPVSDARVLDAFARIRAKAGIDRPVLLSVADELGSPVALATGEICVSGRVITQLSDAQLESVLAHELAHVRRRDPVWLGVAAVIEAVFFFQPLNRVARRGMQESAEYLCDDRAVAWTGSGLALARSLAEVAGWRGQAATSPLVAAMVRREGPLVRRVGRLLDEGRSLDREPGRGPAAAVSLFGIAGLVALAPGLVSASGPDEDDEEIMMVVVDDDDDPHVIQVDASELDHETIAGLERLAAWHDPEDDGRESRSKRKRRKKEKERHRKPRRARRGGDRDHDDDHEPQILIIPRVHVPEVHVPEIRVPNIVIPEIEVPQMRVVVPPMPPMPPQEHGEEWEQWERELEREMKKLEKEWEGHTEQWEREHERAMRDHERAMRERERAARDRARAMRERERERAHREHAHPRPEAVEKRLLEEARRLQEEAERQQRRAEQLRRKAEQLRERREAGGGPERL